MDPNGQGNETITWTPNFMHHLVERCTMKVNGLIIDELFSEHLDFLAAFMIPKGSRAGYNRMIGNTCSPFNGMAGVNVKGVKAKGLKHLNSSQDLFLPLPFFFSKDSGLSLPMVSLPYTELRFHFKFRKWDQLMVSIYDNFKYSLVNLKQLKDKIPKLSNVQVWANYAIVTKEERAKVACKDRDMIIEQNQQLNGITGSAFLSGNAINATTSIDLRMSGAVKALFFAARNTQRLPDSPYRGCYSHGPSPDPMLGVKINVSSVSVRAVAENSSSVSETPPTDLDINWYNIEVNDHSSLRWERNITPLIGTAAILYENTPKLTMEATYYSLIQPYFHAKNIPQSDSSRNIIVLRDNNEVGGISTLASGYHMYSYSLNIGKVDPNGSTNYGVLSSASLVLTPGRDTVDKISKEFGPYRVYVSTINHNVLRISKGTLGFPILFLLVTND